MITFAYGCIIGWVSSALAQLMSVDSPLASGPITVEEASWIGSIICLGSLLGILSFGYVCAIIGSKRAMSFIAIPAILYWLMIIFGRTVANLFVARVIAGWTGGAIQCCILIYVVEIADSRQQLTNVLDANRFHFFFKLGFYSLWIRRIRGTMGTLSAIMRNSGILLAYIIGALLDYNQIPFVFICLPLLFIVNFWFLPSTPQYFIRCGHFEVILLNSIQ